MQCDFTLALFLFFILVFRNWIPMLGNFALTEIAHQVLCVICSNYSLSVLVLFYTFVWVV